MNQQHACQRQMEVGGPAWSNPPRDHHVQADRIDQLI